MYIVFVTFKDGNEQRYCTKDDNYLFAALSRFINDDDVVQVFFDFMEEVKK